MVDKEEKPNCWRNHWALFAGLVIAFALMFIANAVAVREVQAAMAEKLEIRIRANELFRAEVGVKLDRLAEDVKEIKRAVGGSPVIHKP